MNELLIWPNVTRKVPRIGKKHTEAYRKRSVSLRKRRKWRKCLSIKSESKDRTTSCLYL